jgi:hypothetical protein
MRGIMTGLWIGVSGLVVIAVPAEVRAQQAPPPPPAPPAAPAAVDVQRIGPVAGQAVGLEGLLVPLLPPHQETIIAGLPRGAAAELLTWERVYALALIRARSGGNAAAETLDPRALDEQVRRYLVADFARFRQEFLAGRVENGGAFHDPSRAYFRILRRCESIDIKSRYIAEVELLRRLVHELIQGENAGLSQLDLDSLAEALVQGRERASREIAGYCDDLDELKVALGLSPHAPVLPDRGPVAEFARVWDAVGAWQRRPDRHLAELPRIIGRLPELGDALVGGQRLLAAIDPAHIPIELLLRDTTRMEDQLRDAARLAIKNRAGAGQQGAAAEGDVALELRVRRRIRHLLETRQGYDGAKRGYELAIRLSDHGFERLLHPQNPQSISLRTPIVQSLVEDMERIRQAEDRLVALWTSFRAERLELYRDLGALPYGNWDVFYSHLSAAPAAVQPAPAGAGPAPETVPAPPAPPAERPNPPN